MAKLIGKREDDVLVEYYGPITERNYNINGGSPAPTVTAEVVGSGTVEIQESQTPIIKGNAGQNTFTNDTIADSSTWAVIGTIVGGAGPTTLNVTPDDTFSSIRAVVRAEGTGKMVLRSNWK